MNTPQINHAPWHLPPPERRQDRPRLMPGGCIDWRTDAERRAERQRRRDLADWGKRVRAKRQAVGMTLRDLAALVGVSFSVVHNWEAGRWAPLPENRARCDAVLAEALIAHRDLLDEIADRDDAAAGVVA